MTGLMRLARGVRFASLFALTLAVAACSTNTNNPDANNPNASAPPGSVQDFVVNVGDRVFFESDQSDLTPQARATLDKQVQWLQQYSQYSFTVEGHADERGTREYNLALGERRANAAKNYLVSLGVPAGNISTVSYGKERPKALGSTEQAWAQNRRAVTVLIN